MNKKIVFLAFGLLFFSQIGIATSRTPWVQKPFKIESNATCSGAQFDGGVILPSNMKLIAFANLPISVYIKDRTGAVIRSSYTADRMIQLNFVAIDPFFVLVCRKYDPNRQQAQPDQQTQQQQGPVIDAFISSN